MDLKTGTTFAADPILLQLTKAKSNDYEYWLSHGLYIYFSTAHEKT